MRWHSFLTSSIFVHMHAFYISNCLPGPKQRQLYLSFCSNEPACYTSSAEALKLVRLAIQELFFPTRSLLPAATQFATSKLLPWSYRPQRAIVCVQVSVAIEVAIKGSLGSVGTRDLCWPCCWISLLLTLVSSLSPLLT
jgi:hypothetical protein